MRFRSTMSIGSSHRAACAANLDYVSVTALDCSARVCARHYAGSAVLRYVRNLRAPLLYIAPAVVCKTQRPYSSACNCMRRNRSRLPPCCASLRAILSAVEYLLLAHSTSLPRYIAAKKSSRVLKARHVSLCKLEVFLSERTNGH